MHEGESIENALRRETKEELNLDIKPVKQIAVLDLDIAGVVGYWWTCKVLGGEIKTNEEVKKYKYFSAEEIKNLKLWPATRKFFERFIWKDNISRQTL